MRDHVIWVRFSDGASGEVDLADALTGPVFEPLRDARAFRRFHVDPEMKTIVWENGADLAPEFLRDRLPLALAKPSEARGGSSSRTAGPDERVLDLSTVSSRDELHKRLACFFGFPDYYGRNWDAFDECIVDFPPGGTIVIRGYTRLRTALPGDASLLRRALDESNVEEPGFRVRYE